MSNSKTKICLVIPGLSPGGAERVISVLANEFSKLDNIEVHLCLYVKPKIFYELDERIIIHKVDFDYKKLPRAFFTIKILLFLRKKFKEIRPHSFLSFGGKFNSFVLLSAYGLGIKGFVSDRSRPGIKYGFIPDLINPVVYRLAHGIIAQTKSALEYTTKNIKHPNIIVIPNPIPSSSYHGEQKDNIILNVGRFISSKQQARLIKIFIDINPRDWKLEFVGDGAQLDFCKKLVESNGFNDRIKFYKNTRDIDFYYNRSKVFAFTSASEGFPNSLAEAMVAGCACISYDCLAGPSDLLEDGVNGYLIELNNQESFKVKLLELLSNEELILRFSKNGVEKAKELESSSISNKYFQFINK
jgi:GalNAc-alpha-(1->4)-GalNAc-alpha-(1->3)-diNAcBac-PP-undecaprenol alpha-1,4-N-acetyl-D-galactosaminyltransferase